MIITVIVSCNFTSSVSLSSNSTAGEKLANRFNEKESNLTTTSDKRAASFDSVPVPSSLSPTTVSSRGEKPESGNDSDFEYDLEGMEDVKSRHNYNKDNDVKGVGENNITSAFRDPQQTKQLCALVIDRDKNDFTSLPNFRSHE